MLPLNHGIRAPSLKVFTQCLWAQLVLVSVHFRRGKMKVSAEKPVAQHYVPKETVLSTSRLQLVNLWDGAITIFRGRSIKVGLPP